MNPFAVAAVAALAVNAAFFAYAALRRTDAVTDLSYSLSFALASGAMIAASDRGAPLALVPAALTIVWAARLGGYLVTRIRRMGFDRRFDGMRESPRRFAGFWALQAVTAFVVLLPVAAAAASPRPTRSLGPMELLGLGLWAAGFLIEALADAQKSAFKRRGGAGPIMTGLWSWSRHPNYFGEALLWWGVLFYAAPALFGFLWLAALGPAFITGLLLFVSGVPLLERSADERYGGDPAYREYKRRTSAFVPLPPKAGAAP